MKKIKNISLQRHEKTLTAIFFLAISALFLIINSDGFLHIIPSPDGAHDDALQFRLAKSLATGDWLGAYDGLTLAKGFFYPFWLAVTHTLDIPSWFAESVLYCIACLAFVITLRRVFGQKWVAYFAYPFLLFNPMILNRAYRDSIAPALAIMIVSWVIIVFYDVFNSHKRAKINKDVWILTAAAMFALPAWWYLREDYFWILPFVLTFFAINVFGVAVVKRRQFSKQLKLKYVALMVGPFVAVLAVGGIVSALNYRYYGRFVVNDYVSHEFTSAYGALTRIKDDNWQRTVPVSEGMRNSAYEVSPSFLELKSCLDNNGLGACEFFKHNYVSISNADYEGGWFFWALRMAAEKQGYYHDAKTSEAFFVKLADEINAACDSSRLECAYGPRASLAPPFRSEIIEPMKALAPRAVGFLVGLDRAHLMSITPIHNYNPRHQEIADFIGARYTFGDINVGSRAKIESQQQIARLYARINPILFGATLIALVCLTAAALTKKYRGLWTLALICLGLFALIVVRLSMFTYVSVTSFNSINTVYYSSLYPVMFIFEIFTLVSFFGFIKDRKR